jgi:uncharacterized protein with GYD domain
MSAVPVHLGGMRHVPAGGRSLDTRLQVRESADMAAIGFEIHLSGVVSKESLEELGVLDVDTAPVSTVLTVEASDQAALIGLLSRLRAHGLVVTEVRRRPGPKS